jgi:UPF0042 nucleotide-binding protein
MKFIIVSGLSGAGKTVALRSLEDMDAYCIDNLPVGLIPDVIEQIAHFNYAVIALGIDARSLNAEALPALLENLDASKVHYQVVFLQATDAILIKRFSETRRKHPLSTHQISLQEAIQHERQLLAPLMTRADIVIDTSATHLHQLRDLIRLKLELSATKEMTLLLQSFGFKHGIPQDTDFVFDARCLPNPHWEPRLRPFTGKDAAVSDFLGKQIKVQKMLEDIRTFLDNWIPQFEADNRSYLTISIGCTGGRHRSVYMVETLAAHCEVRRSGVIVRHRELV